MVSFLDDSDSLAQIMHYNTLFLGLSMYEFRTNMFAIYVFANKIPGKLTALTLHMQYEWKKSEGMAI